MKKYIILFICSICLSSIHGMTVDIYRDTIKKPTKPLPQAPSPESGEESDPELIELLAELNQPIPQTWQSATPNKTPEANRARTRALNKIHGLINKRWYNGNQGFNISFRSLMGNNLIVESEGVSNWFAACGTLSGLYDQVLIRQQEVIAKQGYWDQFKAVHGRKDVSVFDDFGFNYLETQIGDNCGWELALIMDYYGPFLLVSKEKDIALVVAEIDYSAHSNNYRVYTFDPASKLLAQGQSFKPEYGRTSYDRTLTDIKSLMYSLKAHNNQGDASVYVVVNGGIDLLTGVNQRADLGAIEKKRVLQLELLRKAKERAGQ